MMPALVLAKHEPEPTVLQVGKVKIWAKIQGRTKNKRLFLKIGIAVCACFLTRGHDGMRSENLTEKKKSPEQATET